MDLNVSLELRGMTNPSKTTTSSSNQFYIYFSTFFRVGKS